ncbi:hypothetical protein ABMA27_012188 [Loxostege sticticalis]|uniref:Uncharacterized protein n=1 Tax=Loxostege sticticalis TaxID=481309 RepID=A0ABR3H0T8_LOXSC
MRIELGPETNKANKPLAESIQNILGVNLENLKQNRSLNVLYNKVVENLQFNVSEDKIGGLGGLTLEDVIKKYYGLNAQTPHSVKTIGPTWEETTGIPRQGTPGPPLSSEPDTTSGPPISTVTNSPTSVEKMKEKMRSYRMGYFTIFMAELAHVIVNKPDNEIRLIGLAFQKEHEHLTTKDKFILSFGEPFLSWLRTLVTKLVSLPPDFVRDRAAVFSSQTFYRKRFFSGELNSIWDFLDELYQEGEGVALFRAVERLNKQSGNPFEVMRGLSNAAFAPFKRLTGSVKKDMLIKAINKFLSTYNPPSPYFTGVPVLQTIDINSTNVIQRRFSNKKRFAIVGRKDDGKTKVKIKKPTARDDRYIEREKHKYADIYDKRKRFDVKRYKSTKTLKKQSVKHFQSTAKYPTTRGKLKKNEVFKQKKKMLHKIYKKKENSRGSNMKYNKDIISAKINDYEKKSKAKAKNPEDKQLDDTSETDYTDDHYSNETEHDSNYTDDTKTSNDDSSSRTESEQDKTYISKTPKPKTTSKKYPVKNLTSSNKHSSTTRTFKVNRQTNSKIVKEFSLDEAIAKMEANKNANKVPPIPYDKQLSKPNKGNIPPSNRKNNSETKEEPTIKVKSEIKNKMQDLTSYSDEEDTLKFKLSDALRHSKEYLQPNRRSNHVRRLKKRLNEFSSYSSEEIVLKSNIYKVLGFENFTEPKEKL